MADNTRIEWADASWSPITGCTPVSEGCQNCYAKRMARRLAGRYGYPEAPNEFDVTWHRDKIDQPYKWRKPRRIFVCSMGDLFHEDVVYERLEWIWRIMECFHWHTFLVLTKRPSRMQDLVGSFERYSKSMEWPPLNIALGVTAENQKRADERIPILLQIPAAVRFVSVEPMLGPVDWTPYLEQTITGIPDFVGDGPEHIHTLSYRPRLDWVIVGGETGPGARPMSPDWARDVRDQCRAAGVPFFMKQMAKKVPIPEDLMIREFPDA